MSSTLAILALVSLFARRIVLALVIVTAVAAVVDWLVRTRRVSPFGPIARLFRTRVDPLMVPVERQVLRAGGMPSSTPWWSLVVVLVAGLLLLTLVDFMGAMVAQLVAATAAGGAGLLVLLVAWAFGLLRLALLVRVVVSWLPVSPRSRWVHWSFVLTEWMLAPLRRIIPRLGPFDVTPILAYFLLGLLEGAVLRI